VPCRPILAVDLRNRHGFRLFSSAVFDGSIYVKAGNYDKDMTLEKVIPPQLFVLFKSWRHE
jgi:hypothetical protein